MAKEGHHFPKLDSIVKIQHTNNVNPFIMKELAKDADLPKPRDFDIPMENAQVGSASSSILLPHEMFHYLFRNAKGWAFLDVFPATCIHVITSSMDGSVLFAVVFIVHPLC